MPTATESNAYEIGTDLDVRNDSGTIEVFATFERWPLKAPFSISRYTFTASLVVTIRVRDGHGHIGIGECEPHGWDEAIVAAALRSAGVSLDSWHRPSWATAGLSRETLGQRLERSPVRNAVDCALWDLQCKRDGVRAGTLAGCGWNPVPITPTIGIDTPKRMADIARTLTEFALIKVKLGAADKRDVERMEAISSAVPGMPLLVDVNTAWSPAELEAMLPVARRCNVRIIEQPMLPEFDDAMPLPPPGIVFCGDESCLDRSSLARVAQRFQFINIKLDKAGGLTEALALRSEAERAGMGVMVGMMSGTSLAVAPASLLAQGLDVVDLEVGFMTRDREPPMRIEGSMLLPPLPALWG